MSDSLLTLTPRPPEETVGWPGAGPAREQMGRREGAAGHLGCRAVVVAPAGAAPQRGARPANEDL